MGLNDFHLKLIQENWNSIFLLFVCQPTYLESTKFGTRLAVLSRRQIKNRSRGPMILIWPIETYALHFSQLFSGLLSFWYLITKVFVTIRYTKTNNCPYFFAIWSKPYYWVAPKITMLRYADLVSVNVYHQKAQFSGFKG